MKGRTLNVVHRKGMNVDARVVKKNCDDCKVKFINFNREAFVIEGTSVVICKKCWWKRLEQ